VFNGTNPNGTWELYVIDDTGADGGQISNGWSLQISTPPDTTAPRVKNSTVPVAGATGVAPSVNVKATFTEAMDATTNSGDLSTINGTTFKLFRAGTPTAIGAAVSYDPTTSTATLNPNSNLQLGTKYKAAVPTGAEDLAGNHLEQNPTKTGLQPYSKRRGRSQSEIRADCGKSESDLTAISATSGTGAPLVVVTVSGTVPNYTVTVAPKTGATVQDVIGAINAHATANRLLQAGRPAGSRGTSAVATFVAA
jgi:hypothetical protein